LRANVFDAPVRTLQRKFFLRARAV
jgi:hypothetical protein